MASLPILNETYIFYVSLVDALNPNKFLVDPTIAAGDFKRSTDGSAFVNLTSFPVVEPAGSAAVKIELTASEMDGEKINIQGIDTAGGEWQDIMVNIDIPTGTTESLTDIEEGDRVESNTKLIVNKVGTTEALIDKNITGSLLSPNITIRTTDA